MSKKGLLIAIEGGDGSGKKTQTELLCKHYKAQGIDVLQISYPRYGEASAYYVEWHLNGDYGSADEVPGDLASLTYALDRFADSPNVVAHLKKDNSFVISDRYTASNLAHQGTKFSDITKRHEYYERNMKLEYEIFGIPKPDINIVLLVPTNTAQSNVDKKETRTYTSKKRDIYESDASHLDRAKQNYEELCKLYPNNFIPVECTDANGKMRSIDDIQRDIISIVDKINSK